MNNKVFKTMIALVVIFLTAMYVLKIFFPQEFVMAIENKPFIAIGSYIDNHLWAKCIFGISIGFAFDYLYFGAVCQQLKLHWKLLIVMAIYNVAYTLLYYLLPIDIIANHTNLFICVSDLYMLLTPLLMTRKLLPLSVTYCINSVSQNLSLSIRGLSLLLLNVNSVTILFMSLECYFWMLLCFIIFNYKKESKNNGIL